MKCFLILSTLLCLSFAGFSQEKMIVYFSTKEVISKSEISARYTDRALDRRKRNSVEFSYKDLPVSKVYLQELGESVTIKHVSKWMNAVLVESTIKADDLKNTFSFIKEIEVIGRPRVQTPRKDIDFQLDKSLNYGPADSQAVQISVPCLHDAGYTGSGVFLAVLDAGFNGMDTISHFDSVYLQGRLLDEFDFVGGGSVYQYSGHGTAVSSCIVGNESGQDQYIGTAKDVDLALYVTEDVSSETQVEEFNLAVALERCDSLGVDVVNISLGYKNFDDTLENHPYSSMNGQTTISAIACSSAAARGMIVCTSAGNGGPGTISTPCDADSILCVGAIDRFDGHAWFSSVGPSFDGRVKPDVAARGGESWVIFSDGSRGMANGTSFSSPIMAGAVACLVQANPTKTTDEIIDAVRENSSQYMNPDNLIGYGIPNFCQPFASLLEDEIVSFELAPNPASTSVEIIAEETPSKLLLIDQFGRVVYTEENTKALDLNSIDPGAYYVRVVFDQTVETKSLIIAR